MFTTHFVGQPACQYLAHKEAVNAPGFVRIDISKRRPPAARTASTGNLPAAIAFCMMPESAYESRKRPFA